MLRSDIKNKLNELYPNEYVIISRKKEYTSRDYICLKHKTCGNEFSARLDCVLHVRPGKNHGTRCPHCFGKHKYTVDEMRAIINESTNGEYKLLSKKYVNIKTKILVKHVTCGHNYYVRPDTFLNGSRCPFCIEYKNEKTITEYLNDNDIDFESQKSFDGLIGKAKPLSVDFYVPKYNLVIEYDGEFHYLEEKHANREGAFERQQYNDKTKDSYFKENGYNLLRIPFWMRDDIDDILTETFDALDRDMSVYLPTVTLNENINVLDYIK